MTLRLGDFALNNGSAFVAGENTYKIKYSEGLDGETNIDLWQIGASHPLSIGGVIQKNGHVDLVAAFCHIDRVLSDDEAAKIALPISY